MATAGRSARVLASVADAIGNTPIIRLDRLCKSRGWGAGSILAKLEMLNPGLSKKDRVGRAIVQAARRDGSLQPGQPVVELTSGNTGAALAIVCRTLGHPFIAVMSSGNSPERAKMMRSLGAQVELVPQAPGSVQNQVSGKDLELVEARASSLVAELGAFRADQFYNVASWHAHRDTTGPEILAATSEFDAFVDFAGTGGSFAGCAATFKAHNKAIKCYIAEPQDSRVLHQTLYGGEIGSSKKTGQHKIQGGGYSMEKLQFVVEAYERGHLDGCVGVSDDQAIDLARSLAKEEGILGGFSAGANVAAAGHLIESGQAETVVILVCDSGMKYLSTDLFEW